MTASPPDPHASLRRWLPGFYALVLGVVGAVVPYLALELRSRGMRGGQLALAMGLLPLLALVAGPFWALVADRFQAPGRVTRLTTAVAAVGALWLVVSEGWLAVMAVGVLALGRAPIGPLVDGLALRALGSDKRGYGRLRRWGSLGYLVATLVASQLRDHIDVSPLALGALLSVGVFLGSLGLPAGDRLVAVPIRPALVALSRDRLVPWLLVAAALHFSAHIGTNAFLAVHMDGLGISTGWAGFALSVGVALEIVVLSVGARLLSGIGARWLFLGALLLAVPRWGLSALATTAWQLVALQSLHGLTFGAFWIAGVHLVSERAPERISTSAQGAFSAAVGGVGALLGMAGAALIVDQVQTRHLYTLSVFVALLASAAAWRALAHRDVEPAGGPGA